MRSNRNGIAPLVAAVLLTAACSGGADSPPASAGAAAPDPARPADTLAIPGQGGQLPPGHPPTTRAGGLIWDVPESWSVKPTSSNMRYAEYGVEGPGGTGECIVYYFGPNQGGNPMANAQRWAGQFSQPDGSSSVALMKMSGVEGATVDVQVVEVTGTYDGGMTMTAEPAEPKPGYMLLGGIAQGPDAPWFFKFTGPEATVRAQREAFLDMMRSIRAEG